MDVTILEVLEGFRHCKDLDEGINFLSGFLERIKEKRISDEVQSLLDGLLEKFSDSSSSKHSDEDPCVDIGPVDTHVEDDESVNGHNEDDEPTIFLTRLSLEEVTFGARTSLVPIYKRLVGSNNPNIKRLATIMLNNPDDGFWHGFWTQKSLLKCRFCLHNVDVTTAKRWTNLISHLVHNHANKIPNNLGMNKSYAAIWAENH